MTEANALNAATTGIVGNTGTAFTGTAVTQHAILVGGSTSSTLTNLSALTDGQIIIGKTSNDPQVITPTATGGGNLSVTANSTTLSYGISAPVTIANGGSNATSFGTTHGIVVYDGTSLVNYAGPQISTAGIHTNTSQTGFSAALGANDLNVTGDGTTFIIGSGNAFVKSYDIGTNFNTNGTFTAPVTGHYLFTATITLNNFGASHTAGFMFFGTSGAGAVPIFAQANPFVVAQATNNAWAASGAVVIAMNASATMNISVAVNGASKTVGTSSGTNQCVFTGTLLF